MRGLRFSLALLCSLLLGGVLASASYGATTTVFKDGFESGSLTAWTNSGGTGQEAVTTAAAHTGGYGLNLSGASGQSEKVVKTLGVPLTDSTTEFWMRVDSASGIATVAEARDQANTGYEWVLEYDSAHQQLCFYPYNGSASTEILTGAGSAPMNTWLKVLIVYNATSGGGAELSINGHSPAAWSVGGSYARPDGLQRLQLWYNGAGSTDFDDVVVTTPNGTGAGLSVDKSPPAVTGTATQGQTLTATSGSWGGTPNKYSYAWEDCDSAGNNCQPISGASSNTYVLQASDAGKTVRAVVEARNSVGWSSSTRSVQTAAVTGLPPTNTHLPSVSGTAQQGDQLTADPGQWSGETPMSYSYAWSDGQSGQSITLGSSDVGQTLTVTVTATNDAGSAEATSAIVGPVTSAHAGLNGIEAGNGQFVDLSGNSIMLHGVNRSGTEYTCVHGLGIFDGPSSAASIAAMANWHINIVRLGLNEDCLLGINGMNSAYSGQNYITAIQNYVKLLHQAGMYAEVSLMWTAPGNTVASSQIAAPDEDHSPAAWKAMADAFKGDANVILAPFGEPTVSWSCWINGCAAGASGGTSFATAGAQQAVNVMRGEGFTGVIAVSCIGYANSCSGWVANHPTDPDNNLAAETHVYGLNGCDTDSCFNSTLKPIQAAGFPVLAGETGETYNGSDCPSTSFISDFLNYYQANKIGFEVWTWDTWGGCSTQSLVSNYDGTAESPYGTFVQGFLEGTYASNP
jgi:endoglucanase